MRLTVETAMSDKDLLDRIAGVTGMTLKSMRGLFSKAAPRAHVRTTLREHWPDSADGLAEVSVTTALKLGLAHEAAAVLGIGVPEVETALRAAHGNSRLRVVFTDDWPGDEEEQDEEGDGELDPAQQRLAAALEESFTRAELRDIAVERLGDTDVRANARLMEMAEELVRYEDASLRAAFTPAELRHILGNCGLESGGTKVNMFNRLLAWAEEPSAPSAPIAPPPGPGHGSPGSTAAKPAPSALPALHRVRALLIGNQEYAGKDRLNNPRKDVEDLAVLLRRLGHDVVSYLDLDGKAMLKAVREFKRSLSDQDGVLFYFSGHGLEHHGENWLLPVGFGDVEPEELQHESLGVSRVLDLFDGARFRVCMLDACRSNTYKSRMRGGGEVGLKALQPPDAPGTEGTLICFATSPGKVAWDGAPGENGEFTGALLRSLGQPGRRIEEVMKDVRKRVSEATEKKQIPWENSSLTGDWFPAGP